MDLQNIFEEQHKEDLMACHGCGKTIVPFEPRYAGRERHDEYWHYDCWVNTETGAESIEFQHRIREELPKQHSRKALLDARGGRDEHCPDGFLCNGWRLVRKGGVVLFGHGKHHHVFLEGMVAEYVYCEITDWTGVEITVYPYGLSGRDQPSGIIYPEFIKERSK